MDGVTDMTPFEAGQGTGLEAVVGSGKEARGIRTICHCVVRVLASFVTNRLIPGRECWNLTPFQGPGVSDPPCGFWRLYETSVGWPQGYPWYGFGAISRDGTLIDLPSEFCSTQAYDGFMELQIGCVRGEVLIWPDSGPTIAAADRREKTTRANI